MDWLIYIGGYSIFSSIVNILHGLESYALYGEFRMKRPFAALMVIDIAGTIMVWVWICKKYL